MKLLHSHVAKPVPSQWRVLDDATKLQYLRARWYDPSLVRFINEDTYEGQIGDPLSLNLYTYTLNNPLKYTDPSGNCPVCIIPIINPGSLAAIGAGLAAIGLGIGVGQALDSVPTPIVDSPPPVVDDGINIYIPPIEHQTMTVTQTTFGNNAPTIFTTLFLDQAPMISITPVIQKTPTAMRWQPGTPVTEQQIRREAMKDAPLSTQQKAVSLPAIQRYAERLAKGEAPPAIKVDGNIIVDGNHRYIASRLLGIEIAQLLTREDENKVLYTGTI